MLTVSKTIKLLVPKQKATWKPNWSPDLFGICGYILHISGAYHQVIQGCWPPGCDPTKTKEWEKELCEVAESWVFEKQMPSQAVTRWKTIREDHAATKIQAIRDSPSNFVGLIDSLIELCIIADLAYDGYSNSNLLIQSELIGHLNEHKCLNKNIDKSVTKVMPKLLTSQVGMSLRSLSNNLALCTDPEVNIEWQEVAGSSNATDQERDETRILLMPWPYEVNARQFSESLSATKDVSQGYGLFKYETANTHDMTGAPCELIENLDSLFKIAKQSMGEIHGVVFPELSMTLNEYKCIRDFLNKNFDFAICGIHCGDEASNELRFLFSSKIPGQFIEGEQKKHHRWKLDKGQIRAYGIADQLSTDKEWFEDTPIGDRKVSVVRLDKKILSMALICEDLARQDPVSQVIRTVGPNLVFALLMDGPQLKTRWSARYATVLSDDPGSAVLTLTSLGMATRSKPRDNPEPNRTIGLWSDPFTGTTEINLTPNSQAAILTLNMQKIKQNTADLRSPVDRHVPILDSITQISAHKDWPT